MIGGLQNIEITIDAKDQTTKVFLALKRLKPDILLGPTLDLLRSKKPFRIETVRFDNEEQLISVKAMVEEIERLSLNYEITFCEYVIEVDQSGWKQIPKSKADLDMAIAKKKAWLAECQARAEIRKNTPPPPTDPIITKVSEIFHERWKRLGLNGLLPEERDYVLMWCLHVEVTNGGLDQYLYNSTGDDAQETVEVLKRAGCSDVAYILERTLNALPGGWCSDREERIRRLEMLNDSQPLIIEKLDVEYDKALEHDSKTENNNSLIDRIVEAYRREGIDFENTEDTDNTPIRT